MRKFIFFVLLILSNIALYGQDKKLTINLSNQPITSLFKQIQQQCGYVIIYSDEVVSDTMLVSVKASDIAVSQLLNSVLEPKQLFHEFMSDGMIVIGSRNLVKRADKGVSKIKFTGVIVDPKGDAVPFATIALLEGSVQVSGVVANEQGSFQFLYGLDIAKVHSLKISSVGYEDVLVNFSIANNPGSFKEFGKILLKPKARLLKELQVSGTQKMIEMDGGNLIFNVSKSLTAQGSNALEVLNRAPGVSVGTDNSISLNGKAGAAILIDGKQTYLSGSEVAELLRSMSSSNIKAIEIINSPSARYDATGTAGIINVKTFKSLVQGFNAAITSGISYGVYVKNNEDLSFNFRKNRFNIYGNYSHFIGNYSYLYGADRLQEQKFYNSFTDDVDKRKKMGTQLGADFAINKNHTVGILLNGNFLFGGGITDTRTEIGEAGTETVDQVLTAINDYYHQETQRYNVNLNYKYEDTLGRMINFDADYGDFTKGSGNLQSNKYTSASNTVLSDNLYRSINAIDISLRAVKLDYTTNLWKGKLETGAKYSSVSADNDSRFLSVESDGEFTDQSRSNRFVYHEKIASGYFNYKKDLGKWQFQGGLRVENSSSEGKLDYISSIAGNAQSTSRDYTNLFPFFSVMVKPSQSHSYSLSYSKRIDRPAYQSLNPFIYLLDELSYWQGNPFLKPELSNRLMFQYAYNSSTIVGLSYTHTDDFSVEVTDTVDQTRIVMVPRNLGVQKHLALTLTQIIAPFKWWDITFNGTLFHVYNKVDFGAGRLLKLKQTAGRLSIQQNFKLPYQLSGEIAATYNTKRLVGANQFANPTSQVDLGLQRNLFDNKATLKLIFSDIYQGTKATSIQSVGGLYIRNYSYFEARQIKLNFIYRFSSGNSKGPRSRSSALENENGRIP